jgi:hypothetical protein
MDLHLTYAPEGVCISAQFLITAIAILRIRDNQDEFPVRQLGPGSTIICILCFFLSNLFLIIGRIIVQY